MLFELRKLNSEEESIMLHAPIWTALLIGFADGELHASELEKLREVIHVKTFSELNDVRKLYQELEQYEESTQILERELEMLPTNPTARMDYLNNQLTRLNAVLPKLSLPYQRQYVNSLKEIAGAIANAEGGFLGFGTISREESKYLHLPMINEL
jgi:hypothetical protein